MATKLRRKNPLRGSSWLRPPDPDRQASVFLLHRTLRRNFRFCSGQLTEFRSESGELPTIRIGYWLVDKIFTEDVADLIGAAIDPR